MDDVSYVLMAVSGEVTDATRRKVSIIGLDLEGALKRVSTQFEIESQAVISHIQAELERDDNEAPLKVAIC